jgi:hypothetical protein
LAEACGTETLNKYYLALTIIEQHGGLGLERMQSHQTHRILGFFIAPRSDVRKKMPVSRRKNLFGVDEGDKTLERKTSPRRRVILPSLLLQLGRKADDATFRNQSS